MSEHVCRLFDPWPTGHPLPPEDPAKLQGPEVGTFAIYHPKGILVNGQLKYNEPRVVKVIARSYVWSPGECRSKGGYRHYDRSVVEEGPGKFRSVVVNDEDLTPIEDANTVRVFTRYEVYP